MFLCPVAPNYAGLGVLGKVGGVVGDWLDAKIFSGLLLSIPSRRNLIITHRCGVVTAMLVGTLGAACSGGADGPLDPRDAVKSVASVTVTISSPTLDVGTTTKLTARALDQNGAVVNGALFVWRTSDAGVAQVANDGTVTALKAGKATITILVVNASASASLEITVRGATTQIQLNKAALLVAQGSSSVIAAQTQDAQGTPTSGMSVSWASTNATVARVSSTGEVTAVSPGETFLYASAGSARAVALVHVTSVVSAPGWLAISAHSGSPNVRPGHTCAIATSGEAYCWGSNQGGKLGTGSTFDENRPTKVAGALRFVQVSSGAGHTCGLTSSGDGYCWGEFDYASTSGFPGNRLTPTAVLPGQKMAAIFATASQTCALFVSTRFACWGSLLGGSSIKDYGVTLQLKLLSVGAEHACAVASDGLGYCWGNNSGGELGDGTGVNSTSPVAVSGGRQYQSISAGYSHSCGVATDGAAFCWGRNGDQQIGDGTQQQARFPTKVATSIPLTKIYASDRYSCALDSQSRVLCWGYAPPFSSRQNPQLVPLATNFMELTLGAAQGAVFGHMCALRGDGTAWCQGNNQYGQLGIGSTAGSDSPAQVPAPSA
jgi:alpha-tubulin suppressor-like RCC1 family protein